MSKHDSTRRSFLVRAAVGAGAAAGSGLVPDIYAQTLGQPKQEAAEQPHANAVRHGAFFNYEQAATMAAFTERLMPGAPGKPGANDAGVLNYIDLALAGAYADLQDFYRSRARTTRCLLSQDLQRVFRSARCQPTGRGDCRNGAGEGG